MFWFFAKAARCLIATPAVESVSAPAVMNTDNADTEGGNCWICHEEGPNENGQQLMSGCCSCRGSSGYVHLPCMLEFAKTNTEREVRSGRIDRCALVKIWLYCPNCNQEWTGATATSMGEECVEFFGKEISQDKELKIVALGIKRSGVFASLSGDECAQACYEILSAIEEYESTTPVQAISRAILSEKYMARIGKGTAFVQNDPVCAIEHFEKSKEVLLQMGVDIHDVMVLQVDTMIAEASVKLPGVDKKTALATLLQHQKHLHTRCEAMYGRNGSSTLHNGSGLASTLIQMKQYAEAKPLLEGLIESMRQVHGPDHTRTKQIEKMLKYAVDIESLSADVESIVADMVSLLR